MKAIILAAGNGARLYPITKEIPKSLLTLKHKPIINYLIELFEKNGITEIGVLGNIKFIDEWNWWKKRWYPNKKIVILFDEKKPRGTFRGLAVFKNWLGSEPFFVSNGDEIKDSVDLKGMFDFHQKKFAIGTIALVKVKDSKDYGVAVLKGDNIQDFLEKPPYSKGDYINSGLYILQPEIFKYLPKKRFSMLEKNLFPKLAKKKQLYGFKFKGKWLDTGTWERYEKALKI